VLVYAQTAGSFTVELQDENGVVLETLNATVPAGSSRVELDFDVPVANNLRLVGRNINTGGGLYRNNNSATYPYDLQNVLSIIGASAGASYYYFFYDWEIHTANSTCSSTMTAVEAVVSNCASIAENIPFKQSINLSPNPSNGEFQVSFSTQSNGNMQAELINLVGAQVWTSQLEFQEGKNIVEIRTSDLAKGMYIFNMLYEGKKYPTRVVIE
jgi:hypothetical protein